MTLYCKPLALLLWCLPNPHFDFDPTIFSQSGALQMSSLASLSLRISSGENTGSYHSAHFCLALALSLTAWELASFRCCCQERGAERYAVHDVSANTDLSLSTDCTADRAVTCPFSLGYSSLLEQGQRLTRHAPSDSTVPYCTSRAVALALSLRSSSTCACYETGTGC